MTRRAWVIEEWRYSGYVLCTVLLIGLSSFYYVAGIVFPDRVPEYFESRVHLQGLVLLFVLVPAYIAFCFISAHRRSLLIAREIDLVVGDGRLQTQVSSFSLRGLLTGAALGFLYAVLFNIPQKLERLPMWDMMEISVVLGQVSVWVMMGLLLAYRGRIAIAVHRAGEVVPIDLFDSSRLKSFAQIGLIDILIVIGGLLISTVQSLDFRFRPDNYTNALIVLIPAIVFLQIYPMSTVHKRLKLLRNQQLAEINEAIARASKALHEPDIQTLEALLQRRYRVSVASTWPIDTSTARRFLFYIIIPPLAWVGAALVEIGVELFLN